MPEQTKMVDLTVEETSGVDHPAHLVEGWLVAKAASDEEAAALLDHLTGSSHEESDMPDDTKAAEKDAQIEALTEKVDDLTKSLEAVTEERDAALAAAKSEEPAGEDGAIDPDVEKSLPESVRVALAKAREDAEAARAEAREVTEALEKARIEQADRDMIAKASGWTNLGIDAKDVGKSLRRLKDTDDDLFKQVESMMSSLSEQVRVGALFSQRGPANKGTGPGSAHDEMRALAKAKVEAGEVATVEQGMTKVARENRELYERYRAEKQEV